MCEVCGRGFGVALCTKTNALHCSHSRVAVWMQAIWHGVGKTRRNRSASGRPAAQHVASSRRSLCAAARAGPTLRGTEAVTDSAGRVGQGGDGLAGKVDGCTASQSAAPRTGNVSCCIMYNKSCHIVTPHPPAKAPSSAKKSTLSQLHSVLQLGPTTRISRSPHRDLATMPSSASPVPQPARRPPTARRGYCGAAQPAPSCDAPRIEAGAHNDRPRRPTSSRTPRAVHMRESLSGSGAAAGNAGDGAANALSVRTTVCDRRALQATILQELNGVVAQSRQLEEDYRCSQP